MIHLVIRKETPRVHRIMLWLSSTPVMAIQTFPTTSFSLIKFSQHVKPATLLAEPLLLAADDDDRRLGVPLADLVPPVILAAPAKVRSAPVDRARLRAAARRARPPRCCRPRPGALGEADGEILELHRGRGRGGGGRRLGEGQHGRARIGRRRRTPRRRLGSRCPVHAGQETLPIRR